MNYRTVASATAIVTLLFGLAFVLAPQATIGLYRAGTNLGPGDEGLFSMCRFFGDGLLMTAALAWGTRNSAAAELQTGVARLLALATLVGAGIAVHAVLAGTTNALGWSSVVIYALFALLWARLGWMK